MESLNQYSPDQTYGYDPQNTILQTFGNPSPPVKDQTQILYKQFIINPPAIMYKNIYYYDSDYPGDSSAMKE